jgi:hypothetical protein
MGRLLISSTMALAAWAFGTPPKMRKGPFWAEREDPKAGAGANGGA